MSIYDILPTALRLKDDPIEWSMYLDQLIDSNFATTQQITTCRKILVGLEQSPFLIPILLRKSFRVMIAEPMPVINYSISRGLDLDLFSHVCFIRPEWMPDDDMTREKFKGRVTPWRSSVADAGFDAFREAKADSPLWRAIVQAFYLETIVASEPPVKWRVYTSRGESRLIGSRGVINKSKGKKRRKDATS